MEEFLKLNRNNKYNNTYYTNLIHWQSTYDIIKHMAQDVSLENHNIRSFAVKIRCNELPTINNLVKRNPELYKGIWRCSVCKQEDEDYDHL